MFPKTIWRYWAQGWDQAPFMIRYCGESVKHYASDWDIRNIDQASVQKYIDLPTWFNDIADLPIQIKANTIRMLLLSKYGGVWIDATCFLNTNLTPFLESVYGDIFCFWRWQHKSAISNWFIASDYNSYATKRITDTYIAKVTSETFLKENRKYFKSWRGSPNYFAWHQTVEQLKSRDGKFAEIMAQMPFRDSLPVLESAFYGWNRDVTHELAINILTEKSPLVKLSYSVSEKDFNPNSSLGLLLDKMHGSAVGSEAHKHFAHSFATTHLYDGFLNTPEKVDGFSGAVESEGSMGLYERKYPRWHVYNFASINRKNGTQLLAPYGDNRLFMRIQEGEKFSEPKELAYQEQVEALKKEVNRLFWLRYLDKIKPILPSDVTPASNSTNPYLQFYIDDLPRSIHYELKRKGDRLFFGLHCEDNNLITYLSAAMYEAGYKLNARANINEYVLQFDWEVTEDDIKEKSRVFLDSTIDMVRGLGDIITNISLASHAPRLYTYEYYSNLDPDKYENELKLWYLRKTGRYIDLNNPRTIQEKIQWMKLYDDNPLKSRLTDKYLVREYVAEKIGSEYLTPLLGVWDTSDQIDFAKLPKQFILKCNHGCGYNIMVRDKDKMNFSDIRNKLNTWLKINYSFCYGFELQYNRIKRKIIAEELLEMQQYNNFQVDDYKFLCFNGEVKYIKITTDHATDYHDTYFTRDGNFINIRNESPNNPEIELNLPAAQKMVELAEKLSAGFPHVRVDFYYTAQNEIKFGEMTFTTSSGLWLYQPDHINMELGDLIQLPISIR